MIAIIRNESIIYSQMKLQQFRYSSTQVGPKPQKAKHVGRIPSVDASPAGTKA